MDSSSINISGMDTERPLPRKRVMFINRSYWPDAEATGQLLTELCEDLSTSFDVTVICGQPNDNPAGEEYRRRGTQLRNGVRVRRVRHTRFQKRYLPGRIVNYLSFLWGAFWAAFWARRPDVVVVETDPPLLCVIGWYLQRVRGAKMVIYLQDIHPDIAVALGKIRNGRLTRFVRRLLFHIYRRADRVVVLSRDMRQHVIDSGVDAERVVSIPNWIDTEHVRPVKDCNAFREQHKLNGEFVAMYSGNLGLCQRLDDLIAAAGQLKDRQDIRFLFVGEGALKADLVEQVLERALPNVRFLPYQPKSKLAESLSAADLHLVPLDPRIASCLMPCKLSGVLASGTAYIAVAPENCELAELTRERGVGLVVPPGQPKLLADQIANFVDQRQELQAMGSRGRRLAEVEYDRRCVTPRFAGVLEDVLGIAPEAVVEEPGIPAAQLAETL
jgi:colanic acid biosynthesis glycosyl transferase WcaI